MGDYYAVTVKVSHVIPEETVSNLLTPPFGYEGVRNLGIVKGISVRTRNICADICIVLNALFGGTNYLLVQLYHDTRQEAYNHMVEEALKKGANGVLGVSYESTEIGVLCYGTAVILRKFE
jgi:uncharacterized protein YbjQ (UPF0145 family)